MEFNVRVYANETLTCGVLVAGDWRHTMRFAFCQEGDNFKFIDTEVDDSSFYEAGPQLTAKIVELWTDEINKRTKEKNK
jgi:hypothetical protein